MPLSKWAGRLRHAGDQQVENLPNDQQAIFLGSTPLNREGQKQGETGMSASKPDPGIEERRMFGAPSSALITVAQPSGCADGPATSRAETRHLRPFALMFPRVPRRPDGLTLDDLTLDAALEPTL
jgi:hypothetical protein